MNYLITHSDSNTKSFYRFKHLYAILFIIILTISISSCNNKINYQKLGFEKDINNNIIEDVLAFDNHAPSSNSLTLDDRIDFDLKAWDRIIETEYFTDYEGNFHLSEDNRVSYLAFDKDKIKISLDWYLSNDENKYASYYLDVEIKNNIPKLAFETRSEITNLSSAIFNPIIDVIESNGIYSYGVRRPIMIGEDFERYQLKIQIEYYKYFWAIAHTKNFPYSVYFNQDMILFISRNRKFDRKALNLNKIDDHLTFLK